MPRDDDITYSCKLSRKDMNMKKVSLLAIALSTASINGAFAQATTGAAPASCPKAFQGFHLGGNIGYGVGFANAHFFEKVRNGNQERAHTNLGIRGVDGGIGVGYTQRFGLWALGIAFDANWTGSKGKRAFSEIRGPVRTHGHNTLRLRNTLDLYARFGYVIGGQAMPFVKLGWQNAQWKHTQFLRTGNVPGVRTSKSKRLNGLLWGLGVDFLATKHVVVGFEYTGSSLNSLKETRTNSAGTFFKTSAKPQYNKFALTLKLVY